MSLHQAGKRAAAFAALKQVESIATEIEDGLRGVERLLEAINLVNIVVLQADGRRFGLVVEGINDTEEIVVKPLGKQLKGVALFAGATIMGDGRVSLILDVAGIAQRAGLVSAVTKRLALDETKAQQKQKVEQSAFLLLRNGADGRVAVPLSLVARLEGDSLLGDRVFRRSRGGPVPQPDHSPGEAFRGAAASRLGRFHGWRPHAGRCLHAAGTECWPGG